MIWARTRLKCPQAPRSSPPACPSVREGQRGRWGPDHRPALPRALTLPLVASRGLITREPQSRPRSVLAEPHAPGHPPVPPASPHPLREREPLASAGLQAPPPGLACAGASPRPQAAHGLCGLPDAQFFGRGRHSRCQRRRFRSGFLSPGLLHSPTGLPRVSVPPTDAHVLNSTSVWTCRCDNEECSDGMWSRIIMGDPLESPGVLREGGGPERGPTMPCGTPGSRKGGTNRPGPQKKPPTRTQPPGLACRMGGGASVCASREFVAPC